MVKQSKVTLPRPADVSEFLSRRQMEMKYKLHVPTSLPSGEERVLVVGQGTRWAPKML
jgi:hypothetical protein